MWPNNGKINLSEDRLKEYQRQQERLKAMASSADRIKPVSADVMIENVLKQSFKKPVPAVVNTDVQAQGSLDLPVWLQCESSMLPGQFKHLWSIVQTTQEFADTSKVFQLLLTSGLHTDVLGYIWNLANKSVPGQLTKQEFYIVLALVGLAQTGCTFNNLSILNLIPSAPIPVLQATVLEKSFTTNVLAQNIGDFQQFQKHSNEPPKLPGHQGNLIQNIYPNLNVDSCVHKTDENAFHNSSSNSAVKSEAKETMLFGDPVLQTNKDSHLLGLQKISNFPCIGSSPTAELESEDDFTDFQSVPVFKSEADLKNSSVVSSPASQLDDFTDFQSADIHRSEPLETVVITQKREIPRIPLPKNLTGKLSGMKSNILKISPESERKLKIMTQPESLTSLPESKISSSNKVSTMPSIAVVGGSRGIGSRLANHSLGVKLEKPKHHHKHKIKLPSSTVNDVLASSKSLSTSNVEELFPKCFQNNGSKTFFLKETKIRSSEEAGSPQDDLILAGNNTRRIEIPMLGTFTETVLPTQAPQPPANVELFSVEEDRYSALREVCMEAEKPQSADVSDDFGDFLCADPTQKQPQSPVASVEINPEPEKNENWSDWSFNTESISKVQTDFVSEPKTEPSMSNFTALDLLTLDKDDLNSGLPKNMPIQLDDVQFEDKFSWLSIHSDESGKETNLDWMSEQPESKSIDKDTANVFEDKVHWDWVSATPVTVQPDIEQFDESRFTAFETEKLGQVDWISAPQPTIQLDVQPSEDFGQFLTPDIKGTATDTLSRHSSLPSLDLKMSPSEETEQELVWRRCLECCLNLLQEGVELFSGACTKPVLDEVFSTQEAVDYLNSLNTIYHVSRRISQNGGETTSIQEEIEKTWRRLDEYCYEYSIKLKEDADDMSGKGSQCGVCSGLVGNDPIEQGMTCYHPTCANLWVNCVEASLPCPV